MKEGDWTNVKKHETQARNVNPTKMTVKTLLCENPIYHKNEKNVGPFNENIICE